MKGGTIKGLAKKFEQGQIKNATGAVIGQDTNGDAGLSTNNVNRENFKFGNIQSEYQHTQDEAQLLQYYEQRQEQIRKDEAFARTLANSENTNESSEDDDLNAAIALSLS